MAYKGIRTYTSEETSNILLGQTGFIVIPASKKLIIEDGSPYIADHAYPSSGSKTLASNIRGDVTQFPMIKVMQAGTIACKTIAGDGFSLTGAAPTSGTMSAIDVTVSLGDAYFGAFDEVWTGSATIVFAYIGM